METETDNSFFIADSMPGEGMTFSRPELIHDCDGGITQIYRAARSGRIFILKTLRPEYARSPLHRALLRKEFDIAIGLVHPAIATVYSFETVDPLGECIVEEWVDGLPLDRYIAANKPSRKAVMDIMLSIAEALGHIHSRQIVHRDIKPANIIIATTGSQPKIIDFGLADSTGLTMVKGPGGTDGYAAPEQYQPGSQVTHRADIFAFGRILQLTGHFPKTGAACTACAPEARPASMTEVMRLMRREAAHSRRALTWGAGIAAVIAAIWFLWPSGQRHEDVSTPSLTTAPEIRVSQNADKDSTQAPPQSAADGQPPLTAHTLPEEQDKIIRLPAPDYGEPSIPAVQTMALPADAPYAERLRAATLEAASRRFAAHIASADTAGPTDGYRLYYIAHWRHLAKEDMRRWIERNPDPDNPYNEDAAAVSRGIIDDYYLSHLHQHKAGQRRIEDRLGKGYVIIPRYVREVFDDGSYVLDTLGEDDLWHSVTLPPEPERKVHY